jgi:hypothetical protein
MTRNRPSPIIITKKNKRTCATITQGNGPGDGQGNGPEDNSWKFFWGILIFCNIVGLNHYRKDVTDPSIFRVKSRYIADE